jgi:exportin-2 (importin alpha re-exporter)
VVTNPATLPEFENTLFGPFTFILQQDIDCELQLHSDTDMLLGQQFHFPPVFIPYVFQILSQMLELQQAGLPEAYRSLLPLLLTPAPWQQKGSIPGLVRLLRAFLARDAPAMCANGQIKTVLAVAQQRLIPSKINDIYGFELLQAVVTSVPIAELQKYFRDVLMSLLTRLQTTRTDRFANGLALFFSYIMAAQANDLSPDFLISAVENIQPQYVYSLVIITFMCSLAIFQIVVFVRFRCCPS